MSSLTPPQAEIAFTVSQRSPSKVNLHVYGAHAYTITNRCRCDPLYILKTTCLPHQTVYFHCVELSGLLNFLIYPGGGSQIHVLR